LFEGTEENTGKPVRLLGALAKIQIADFQNMCQNYYHLSQLDWLDGNEQ
jgi:hypothetical protein